MSFDDSSGKEYAEYEKTLELIEVKLFFLLKKEFYYFLTCKEVLAEVRRYSSLGNNQYLVLAQLIVPCLNGHIQLLF